MRDFQKLKNIQDYQELDRPIPVESRQPPDIRIPKMMILRMLVRPKYGHFYIPEHLKTFSMALHELAWLDERLTGIKSSWCYVTIRHGEVTTRTDDEWHFDGSSFRVDIIPERNYIWTSCYPTEFKTGSLNIPSDFDPIRHNLFTFAAKQLKNSPVETVKEKEWCLLSPFVLHRRPSVPEGTERTFIRICFTDIEGRDINNTGNPFLPTPAFGRDPVNTFRNKLAHYYG